MTHALSEANHAPNTADSKHTSANKALADVRERVAQVELQHAESLNDITDLQRKLKASAEERIVVEGRMAVTVQKLAETETQLAEATKTLVGLKQDLAATKGELLRA